MPDGGTATVHDAPEVRVKEALLIFERHFGQLAVYRNAGIVHPRIEPAELADGGVGDAIEVSRFRHIRDRVGRASAACIDLIGGTLQILFVARSEDDSRAARGGDARGGQPYST